MTRRSGFPLAVLGRRLSTKRGLSLVEMLTTLFVASLIMGVIGTLLTQMSRVEHSSRGKDKVLEGMRFALDRIRTEVSSSTSISSPSSGTAVPTLQFSRIDPTVPGRIPSPLPTPPTLWDPRDPSYLVSVQYFVQDTTLYRQAGSGPQETLAEGVAGFSCALNGDGTLQVTLSVDNVGVVQPLTSRIWRWNQ